MYIFLNETLFLHKINEMIWKFDDLKMCKFDDEMI